MGRIFLVSISRFWYLRERKPAYIPSLPSRIICEPYSQDLLGTLYQCRLYIKFRVETVDIRLVRFSRDSFRLIWVYRGASVLIVIDVMKALAHWSVVRIKYDIELHAQPQGWLCCVANLGTDVLGNNPAMF